MEDPEFHETPAYEPPPLAMSGLRRTEIRVPPRLLEGAFGYKGEGRYVSFHWSPRHSKLFLCDGPLCAQLSDAAVWPRFLAHPLIAPHLQHFTADYKHVEAFEFSASVVPIAQSCLFSTEDEARRMDADVVTSCLLLDRRDVQIYAGPWSEALSFHSLVGDERLEFEDSEEPPDKTPGDVQDRLIRWLDEHLDDADQLFSLAAAFHGFKQYRQTLDTLLRCVQLRPESDEFHLRLSQTYGELERWEDALTVCEMTLRLQAGAIKRNVTPQAIFMWLGWCQFKLRRYAEAAETYQLVAKVDPYLKGVDACHQRGRCLTKLGRHKEAIAAHQTAVRLQAHEAAARLLSMNEWDQGEFGPDLVEMDRGLIGDSLEELGKAHLLAGQLRDAEQSFRQALKAQPDSVRAHGCLALVHKLMDKTSIAAEEFNIAAARACLVIERRPDCPSAHGDLAFVYRAMGNDSAAAEESSRAVELGWRTDPDEDLFALVPHAAGTASSASSDHLTQKPA